MSAAEAWSDDPPESGIRLRRSNEPAPRAAVRFTPRVELAADPGLPVEAFAEAVLSVWGLFRVVQPLQGMWLLPGHEELGLLLTTVLTLDARALRQRWPELVPGAAALDWLAGQMVDWLCR